MYVIIKPFSITFPKPFNTLVPGNGLVGINRAAVSWHRGALRQVDLSLEPDLHHISWLSEGHRHRPRGAACQEPGPNSNICCASNSYYTSRLLLPQANRVQYVYLLHYLSNLFLSDSSVYNISSTVIRNIVQASDSSLEWLVLNMHEQTGHVIGTQV